MKNLFVLFAISLLLYTNVHAQLGHSLQVDDGAQHYSTIVGSSPGAVFTLPPGPAAQTILTSGAGSSTAWILGGNNNPLSSILGTLTGQDLDIRTSNSTRIMVLASGNIGIGIPNPGTMLANNNANIQDQSGDGLNGGSITWKANAGGYVAGFENLDNISVNPHGIIAKTASVTTNTRIFTANSGGLDRFQVFGDGSMLEASGNLTVGTDGDLTKIKNVSYVWPASQAAAANYVLTNDGIGNLSWAPGGGTGQPKFALSTQNANYNAVNTDQLIQADVSANNVAITLPNANTFNAGQTIIIKVIAPANPGTAFTCNVVTSGGQLIDDGNAGFLFPLNEGQVVRLYSTGNADWYTW